MVKIKDLENTEEFLDNGGIKAGGRGIVVSDTDNKLTTILENKEEVGEDIEYIIKDIIKSIDPNFEVIFSHQEFIVSLCNKKNGNGDYTKTFDDLIQHLESYKILEELLLENGFVVQKHKFMQIDNLRIKVHFAFNRNR